MAPVNTAEFIKTVWMVTLEFANDSRVLPMFDSPWMTMQGMRSR
jgi:hypothetical protein